MDETDRASSASDLYLRGVLADHYAGREPADGDGICVDCGEPIPEARRAAVPGCRRCVECETIRERLRR